VCLSYLGLTRLYRVELHVHWFYCYSLIRSFLRTYNICTNIRYIEKIIQMLSVQPTNRVDTNFFSDMTYFGAAASVSAHEYKEEFSFYIMYIRDTLTVSN